MSEGCVERRAARVGRTQWPGARTEVIMLASFVRSSASADCWLL